MGTLGDDVTVVQGAEAAEVCALIALAVLQHELGSLDRVARVHPHGFVASTPDFHEQPAVVDGASRLLHRVFGDDGATPSPPSGGAVAPGRSGEIR